LNDFKESNKEEDRDTADMGCILQVLDTTGRFVAKLWVNGLCRRKKDENFLKKQAFGCA
jgi:hypothetical protein